MNFMVKLDDARPKWAKHREIAVRYRRGGEKKPFSMASVRCAEIKRLFVDRYGFVLPDDDAAGRMPGSWRTPSSHAGRRPAVPRDSLG